MKIKYIANARMPTEKAHGLQIISMCNEFAKQNIDVELIAPNRFNKIKESINSFYGTEIYFNIKKVFCIDTIPIIKDWLPRFIRIFLLWIEKVSFFLICLKFLDNNPIIYTREPEIALFLGSLKKNCVCEIHALPKKGKIFYANLFKKLNKIITINRQIKNILIKEYDINPSKILVAHDAVDIKKFDIKISKEKARKKLRFSLNKKIVLYTGHLYDWKGADVLAKSIDDIKDKEILLVFVGGTDKDIKSFKNKHKSEQIRIEGRKKHDLIPFYLKAADILILPNSRKTNISKYYTSPLKLFEYMASKRPIIASDLPSIKEIVSKKEVLFFKADDSKDLALNITKLLKDKKLKERLSKNAFEKVKSYTWGKRVKEIINFIQC